MSQKDSKSLTWWQTGITHCMLLKFTKKILNSNYHKVNTFFSCTNIWGDCSNFVECESFLESNSPDILALCETNLNDSIDSGSFSLSGYLILIRKDSVTHMHGRAVYMKEGLPFGLDVSLESSADSYLHFWLALLNSVSYFFFLYQSPLLLCTVFNSVSSNINEVFSINPSTNGFVFGDFNIHHKDWLTYYGGTIDLVNSVIIFLFRMILLRLLTFLLRSLTVTLTVLLFWTYFFLLMLIFVLQWLSVHWKFWSFCCLSFHWLFNKLKIGSPFHHIAYNYSRADWDGLHDHLRYVPWEDILKLSASATVS